jgi:SAM-dependent methyltransferase
MGFIRANIIPILEEHRERTFTGGLLLLGMADVYFSQLQLERMARTARVDLTMNVPVTPSHAGVLADKGYISGEALFRQLGFEKIDVLDVSTFEGATIQFDLNSDETPVNLVERFDVIIDHGTLEHVFHLPNALRNLFRMLRAGGRVVHSAPSGNFFDHGFYMFQPTLFLDYYTANGWDIKAVKVAQYTPDQEAEPAFFADYEPGLFSAVSYGGMDNKLYITVCVAMKTLSSQSNVIPTQGVYASMAGWGTLPVSSRIHALGFLRQAVKKLIR